ncbi:hypothetical protein GW17_00059275 [Ensete ventricosum]|nr:hypothetical protein GW17_00059275 [Ensete ventricosum]
MVAKKVRDILPLKLQASWEVNIGDDECKENNVSKPGSMDSEETSSVCLNEEYRASIGFKDLIKHSEIMATLTEPFLKAFRIVDKELRLHPDVDCFYSGTTAVTLVKQVDYEPLNAFEALSLHVRLTRQVWDVLSNKEVVDIVAMASTRSSAARYVVESAGRAWRLRYPTSRVDDCAVVCLFLNTDSSNSVSAAKAIVGGSPDGIGALSDEQQPPQPTF